MSEITPDILLNAYAQGLFPMAPSKASDELNWYRPSMRGILPLDQFNIPRSLQKFLHDEPFRITRNHAFRDVMVACADRKDTWINDAIIELYCECHRQGFAHSIECWDDEQLVGGLYGVHLKGAFFGESMFSKTSNASKAALVHLVDHLNARDFALLDTQYSNDHLKQFGVREIPADRYDQLLQKALQFDCSF